jgi:CheY-like chemotaxis protein
MQHPGAVRGGTIQRNCLVSNLNLPDMIGVEAITILKRIPVTSGIPIVVLTAETARRWKTKALKAGAAEYLLKPISPRDLLQVVRRFCRPSVPSSEYVAHRVRRSFSALLRLSLTPGPSWLAGCFSRRWSFFSPLNCCVDEWANPPVAISLGKTEASRHLLYQDSLGNLSPIPAVFPSIS